MKLVKKYFGKPEDMEKINIDESGNVKFVRFEDKILVLDVEYDKQTWNDAISIAQSIVRKKLNAKQLKEIIDFINKYENREEKSS